MADTDYLAASDGTGDAALMHVSSPRTAGATIIQVDTVAGVPAFFIGTWGTLLASGFIDPTTKRDFFGHVNAGTLVIDKMAPGNTDAGNTTGQVVVIKPSTPAQNTVSSAIKAGTTFPAQFANFVEPGGAVWTINSGLIGQMSAGFVWYNGARTAVSAVATHTFGTSVDTYIDINPSTGTVTYVPVANGASEPAITASSVRVAKVITSGSAITQITYTNYTDPKRNSETIFNYIAYGCTWTADAAGSTLLATMTPGVVYINGKRLTVAGVTSRAFSASVDTYVDFQDNNDGTAKIIYSTVSNNVTSPAIPNSLTETNNVRNAIIVSGATNIAAATSINQGQEDRTVPAVSSDPLQTTDTFGNLICPRDPQRKTLGCHTRITQALNAGGTAVTDLLDLAIPVIVPFGRKIKVTIQGEDLYASVNNASAVVSLWEGVVGSGRQLLAYRGFQNGGSGTVGVGVSRTFTPLTSNPTLRVGLASTTTGNSTIDGSSGSPITYTVELA